MTRIAIQEALNGKRSTGWNTSAMNSIEEVVAVQGRQIPEEIDWLPVPILPDTCLKRTDRPYHRAAARERFYFLIVNAWHGSNEV